MSKNILENGQGKVPKLVLSDNSLSITAKGIYVLLCVYKGESRVANPKRETIMKYLGIGSKNTYYKHLKQLEDSGYIKVTQCFEVNKFCANNFTVFDEITVNKKTLDVWSKGYSIVPRKLINDKRLSIVSKVIYTYIASYRVESNPSCEMISSFCGIKNSNNLFSSLKELEEHSYILRENTIGGKYTSSTFKVIGYDAENDKEIIEKLNKKLSNTKPIKNTNEHTEETKTIEVIKVERTEINKRQLIVKSNKEFVKSFNKAENLLRKNLKMAELEQSSISDQTLKPMFEFFESSINLMLDVIFSSEEKIRVSNNLVLVETLRELFFNLSYEKLEEVYVGVSIQNGFIKNEKQYVLTSIYNAITTPSLKIV